MTNDFELLMLRYLAQPEQPGKKFIPLIGGKVFEHWDHKVIITTLDSYYTKYGIQPSKTEFIQFTENEMVRKDFQDDEIDEVVSIIEKHLYKPLESNEGAFVRDTIVEHAQARLTAELITENADKINDGPAVLKHIFNEMAEIIALADETENVTVEEGTLIHSEGTLYRNYSVLRMGNYQDDDVKLLTTPFIGLNNTMGAGGIHAPDLAVLMGGSKAFKTGILLTIAAGMVRLGYKVYYADGENGLMSIQGRYVQALVKCTLGEYIRDEFEPGDPLKDGFEPGDHITDMTPSKVFKKISRVITKFGGEFSWDSYSPSACTMNDVETKIRTKMDRGFKPDLIIFDSMMHFSPIIKQQTDVLNSQQTLKEAIALNKKLGTASLTGAQTTRQGNKEDIHDIEHIGRDLGIVQYATNIWSINRNKDEEEAGLAQLYAVVQRGGKARTIACMLKLQEEKMQATEISYEEAADLLSQVVHDEPPKRKRKTDVNTSDE